MQGKDLTRYFGLQFVTSSLEKKAETSAVKAKLDQDSNCVPGAASLDIGGSSSDKAADSEQKHSIHPSLAYEIAISAASYVQSRAKNMLSLGSEKLQEYDEQDLYESRDQTREERESSSHIYKSEVAAYMAASTMTTVVAAGEKAKLEAAKDLQSLHSSPCEWFVCDDSSTYTRCFVIQVTEVMLV